MKSLDHVNIDSVNSLYLVFNNSDGYIEESNGDKYLIFASTIKYYPQASIIHKFVTMNMGINL